MPETPIAAGYDCDSRFIAAHYQPATLIDLALSRGIDSHCLLRGCELFHEDIVRGQARVSPRQFLTLIGNAERLLGAADSSFLFGQRLLPGHYGEASHALLHALDLQQALDHLCRFRAVLSPLLRPYLLCDEQQAHLYWLDSCGSGAQQRFVLEAGMTAVVSMARRLSGEPLPWRFHLAHPQPRQVEQYWVHLGEQLRFNQPLNRMSLPREYLHRRWPHASSTAGGVAQQGAQAQLDALGWSASFIDQLHDHLREHIRSALNLERVALAFGMSPSSFKRRLQKHGTHFQEQLDLVRTHVAIHLYQAKGYTNEEVAAYLRFNDTTNFRRSFKRWTGLVPSSLRQLL